jgi:hypothetical protein
LVDDRAILGARNNADWYEAVFEAHGLGYSRLPCAFIALDTPPPYFAALTVLSPDDEADLLRELARAAERFGGVMALKDSFRRLDPEANGFETLFEASWIWRAPQQATMPEGWVVVRRPGDLSLWEDGWKRNGSPTDRRMFPEPLLARDDVFFLGRKVHERFVAGCIANLSDDSVGFSNVFSETSINVVAEAADAVSAVNGNLPTVGYETGTALDHAILLGFEIVGGLRILVTRNATA